MLLLAVLNNFGTIHQTTTGSYRSTIKACREGTDRLNFGLNVLFLPDLKKINRTNESSVIILFALI